MSDFLKLKTAIEDISGISIEAAKDYLIESRLTPLLKKHKLENLKGLETQLIKGAKAELLQDVVDQIVTPETRFFRDEKMFSVLEKELLPGIFSVENKVNLLSAGSSTGQEAYSLAMLIKTSLPYYFDRVTIHGVDISKKSIDKARRAQYSEFEVSRGLSSSMRDQFLQAKNGSFHVTPKISSKVTFQQLNLLKDSLPGRYDIIFFRNVAIYFSEANKKAVFQSIHHALKKNGILVIGSSESLQGLNELYEVFTLKGCYFYRRI